MYELEIYFTGGNGNRITEVSEEVVENLLEWLDDKSDNKTFKFQFNKHNKLACYRKEVITYINVIEVKE